MKRPAQGSSSTGRPGPGWLSCGAGPGSWPARSRVPWWRLRRQCAASRSRPPRGRWPRDERCPNVSRDLPIPPAPDVLLVDIQYTPAVIAKPTAEPMVGLIAAEAREHEIGVFRRFDLMKDWHDAHHMPFDAFSVADG